jgi:hypothetical protein
MRIRAFGARARTALITGSRYRFWIWDQRTGWRAIPDSRLGISIPELSLIVTGAPFNTTR